MVRILKNLWSFYSRRERRYVVFLCALTLAMAGIELIAAGAFFAYTNILTDVDIIFQNPYLQQAYQFLGFQEVRSFLLFLGFVIFLILVVRGLLSLTNLYVQSKFAAHMRNALSARILETYIRLPFQTTFSLNSAILSKHLLVEVSNVGACITQTLTLFTELIITFALLFTLLYIDPMLISVVAFVMASATFIIIKFTKNRISLMGREMEQCNADMFKAVSQALQGMKDIKVFRVENFFRKAFNRPLFLINRLSVKYEVISGFPSMVMNLLAFSCLLGILLYLLFTRGDLLSALPLIAVTAFAVQRLLPSITKIYGAIALMRKYEPGVNIIKQTLQELDNVSSLKMDKLEKIGLEKDNVPSQIKFRKSLRLENVSYTYPGGSRKALERVSLEIPKNSVLGIIGSSGVGKSTLVDVLLGLLPVSEGRVLCDGVELTDGNRFDFSKLVGYVPQQTFILDDTLKANIAFGVPGDDIDNAKVEQSVEIAQLGSLVNELPEGLESRIGEKGAKISGGQRQRVGIARALYNEPEILILDEATSALDTAMEAEFNTAIRQLMGERTLILIAHRISSLEFCSQLVLMRTGGSIEAEGTIEELSQSSEEFRRLYGITSPS